MKDDSSDRFDATVDAKFAEVTESPDRRFDRLFEEIQAVRDLIERDRRLDALAAELANMRTAFDAKFDKLLQLHERERMGSDYAHDRLDAYLTRTLSTEKRVEALETAVVPIKATKGRKAARRK